MNIFELLLSFSNINPTFKWYESFDIPPVELTQCSAVSTLGSGYSAQTNLCVLGHTHKEHASRERWVLSATK